MSSRAFNLYLSTAITNSTTSSFNMVTPIDKTNLANVTWRIDWDNLFRGMNYKYRRCVVRVGIQSASWVAGADDWNAYSGYMAVNMPSAFGSTTNNGTMLMFLHAQDAPTTGTTTHCIFTSTMDNACGVDVIMPTGVQQVTFSMYNDDAMTLFTSFPEYQLRMCIELSEPIV